MNPNEIFETRSVEPVKARERAGVQDVAPPSGQNKASKSRKLSQQATFERVGKPAAAARQTKRGSTDESFRP